MTNQPLEESIDVLTERALLLEADQGTRRERSWLALAALTAGVALLMGWLSLSGARSAQTAFVLFGAIWGAFTLATVVFHFMGPRHVASRAADLVDQVVRSLGLLAAMLLWSEFLIVFMLLIVGSGFAISARPRTQVRVQLALHVACHVVGVVVALWRDQPSVGALIALDAFAVAMSRVMSARAHAATVRVRVERDLTTQRMLELDVSGLRGRLARELHDGFGADLMALTLLVRREGGADAGAQPLVLESQGILNEVRQLVGQLRKGVSPSSGASRTPTPSGEAPSSS